MGCTSAAIVQSSRRVVPLPPQTINSYIDRFPAIILLKIKQKFQSFADKDNKTLNIFHFITLHSVTKRNSDMLKRLFMYYTDNQKQSITFRQFIIKYATLIKGEVNILYNILFEIYKNTPEMIYMNQGEFANFYKSESIYLSKQPKIAQFPISFEQFSKILADSQFNTQNFQTNISITTQQDIPFKMISREILDCDFNDFSIGKEYYLLSNAWFYRWSFYYQELDVSVQKQRVKSTKFILPDQNSVVGRRYKKRQNSLRTSQLNNTLFQQPKIIDFQDIEGEYRGQLKENLKISTQIKIITDGLWKLLCSLHPAEQEFKRIAISSDRLEYYPKAAYYFEADDHGLLVPQSQTITFLSVTQKVAFLRKNKTSPKLGIFSKNFGEKNWRQLEDKKTFAQVSLEPRFLIVAANNREKFIQKNYRKQIKKENLQPGDLIYAHLAYVKSHSDAFIVGLKGSDTFKIHFKGYSYRYEVQLDRGDISIMESEAVLSSAKKKHESLIKGISNIGNTCFINSVIQCLIATPILDAFLAEYPFDQKKQPIGYGLATIARALLKNQRPEPRSFKRMVDANMPIFSGYQQHDAQQFLNILLDKISEEITEKPTVIDYLFGGKAQSKLTCANCKNIKYVGEKMYILSLPIPQPQFNYFSIIVVPVTSKTLKKMIFKLHKNALVSDYCNAFQERSGYRRIDFVFVQTSQNSLRKIKEEILSPASQRKRITDVGIVPNVSLLAFEKLPSKYYSDILSSKPESNFKDLQLKPQTIWTICKIISSKYQKNQYSIQYLNPDNTIEKVRIDKDLFKELSARLGSKSELVNKKVVLRKYNSSLKKLEQFGLQFLIGMPNWTSYDDAIKIIDRYIQNLKQKQAKMFRSKKGGDYIIRLIDSAQNNCIFCKKGVPIFDLEEKQIQYCCEVLQKNIPLYWSSKSSSYTIYIDWIDFSKCNSMFCSYIEVDLISRNVENTRQDEFVNLQSCINLHNQTETVEMQCDKCKHKYQNLQHLIDKMPNILIVHMKEFRYTPQGHLIKIDLRLKWQEFLDSSKYTMISNGKLYELFAVVRHSGSSQSGHYTCIAKRKHPFQNKNVWVLFDDDLTDIIKQEQPFIDDAYLLCYKKVDMPTSALVMYSDLNSQ